MTLPKTVVSYGRPKPWTGDAPPQKLYPPPSTLLFWGVRQDQQRFTKLPLAISCSGSNNRASRYRPSMTLSSDVSRSIGVAVRAFPCTSLTDQASPVRSGVSSVSWRTRALSTCLTTWTAWTRCWRIMRYSWYRSTTAPRSSRATVRKRRTLPHGSAFLVCGGRMSPTIMLPYMLATAVVVRFTASAGRWSVISAATP